MRAHPAHDLRDERGPAMNDQEVREILQGFLPGSTVLFLSKDGRRMVLAVDGPQTG